MDCETHGMRLHVAVWDGEFKDWPVWTAFGESFPLTSILDCPPRHILQSGSPTNSSCTLPVSPASIPTWVGRKSRKRVIIRNIEPYIFSDTYQQARNRMSASSKSMGGGGRISLSPQEAFEIHFVHEAAATSFKDMFSHIMDRQNDNFTESSEDGGGSMSPIM